MTPEALAAIRELPDRLRNAPSSCDPDCWGRCQQCPDDLRREAADALDAKQAEVERLRNDKRRAEDATLEMASELQTARTTITTLVAASRPVVGELSDTDPADSDLARIEVFIGDLRTLAAAVTAAQGGK